MREFYARARVVASRRDVLYYTDMGNPRSRMLVGTWLVVWGVVLLLVSNHVLLGWRHLWPCILVVTGVVMLRVLQGRLTFGVVFAATWTILLGLFLTVFSFGWVDWGRMRSLWPIIPTIIGASFIVAGAKRPPTSAGVVVGSMVILMGAASFLYETGTISVRVASPFLRFWPLVLILAGFVLMKRQVRAREPLPVREETAEPHRDFFDRSVL
jgi:hypothetical protein